MKLINKLYIFIFTILLSQNINSQSSDAAQGMAPIAKNNLWVYDWFNGFSVWSCINETVNIDSFQYNVLIVDYNSFPQYVRLREDDYFVLRRDSTYNEPNHEEIYYKKNAMLGDSWTQLMFGSDTLTYTSVVTNTFLVNIFNTLVNAKVVRKDLYLVLLDELWTEEFGLISTADFHGVMSYLAGCVINGIVYGDTSTTGINYEQLDILPEHAELLQNYPNPFNSSTIIEYILPKESYVKLGVYNSLGEEVKNLVDEYQRSGKYRVHFSSAEIKDLASGVYFYSLKVNSSIVTRKMILLR